MVFEPQFHNGTLTGPSGYGIYEYTCSGKGGHISEGNPSWPSTQVAEAKIQRVQEDSRQGPRNLPYPDPVILSEMYQQSEVGRIWGI